eukprot:1208327-Pleurochrysis_carterae.AAC.1
MHQTYSFESPSPVAPTFSFPTVPNPQSAAPQPASDRLLRSGAQAPAPATVAPLPRLEFTGTSLLRN